MICSQARRVLYPEPAKCEITIEHAEALRHARQCDSCRRHFREQGDWSRLLKEKTGVDQAPESLRKRVRSEIAEYREAPVRQGIRKRRLALLAAVAAALLLPAVWLTQNAHSASLFRDLCEDHSRYLDAQAEVESDEPEMVASWLRQKTHYAVYVPAFENAQLLGARLCFLREKQAALVFYRKKDRPVSLFQLSEEGVSFRSLKRSVIDGGAIWRGAFQGYNVAAFPQRGLIYVLVSDLRESELLELASEARAQSSRS